MKTWVLRNLQQFHHWLLHPFLLLPFQRFRPAHIPVSGYLGAHLTSRKGTPRAPTITLRAQLDHSCSSCRQPQLCPQPWLWGSDKSALRTGEDKVAKQSKTPNRHTQLIIYVIKYSVWYLHSHLPPVISLRMKHCVLNLHSCCSSPIFTFAFHIPVLQLEKILVKTLLSHWGKGKPQSFLPLLGWRDFQCQ